MTDARRRGFTPDSGQRMETTGDSGPGGEPAAGSRAPGATPGAGRPEDAAAGSRAPGPRPALAARGRRRRRPRARNHAPRWQARRRRRLPRDPAGCRGPGRGVADHRVPGCQRGLAAGRPPAGRSASTGRRRPRLHGQPPGPRGGDRPEHHGRRVVHDIADPYFSSIAAGLIDVAHPLRLLVCVSSTADQRGGGARVRLPDARPAGPRGDPDRQPVGRRGGQLPRCARRSARSPGPVAGPSASARTCSASTRSCRRTPRGPRRWPGRWSCWATAGSPCWPGRAGCSPPGTGWPGSRPAWPPGR